VIARLAVVVCAVVIVTATAHADPKAKLLVTEAERLIDDGKTNEALGLLEDAVASDADYLRIYDVGAPLWLAIGDFQTLIGYLERATLRYPDYAFGWYTLAYAYRRTERFEHSIAAYDMYISLRPSDATPLFGLAIAHKRAGNTDEAIAAYARYMVKETDPERADYIARARLEIEQLGGVPPDVSPPVVAADAVDTAIAAAASLVGEQRYASAEAMLSKVRPATTAQRANWHVVWASVHIGRADTAAARASLLRAWAHKPMRAEVYRLLDSLD
jgi:tetratricopeptide (TPR) repeat protein